MTTEKNYYDELPLIKTIQDEYKQYKAGDLIFIGAGCGTGKTSFIIEILSIFAAENNKKVLFLSNRSELNDEIYKKIDDNGLYDIMTNVTYQSMQKEILLNKTSEFTKENIEKFDYIICDECHYFLVDSWNKKTDISYYQIFESKHPIKIYMTATFHEIFDFLTDDICKVEDMTIDKIHGYRINPNYEYIEKAILYFQDDYVDEIIKNLSSDEKLIYFGKKIERVLELHQKYENSSFICSQHRKDKNNKYINYITKNPIKDNVLTNQLTFATSAWDNGINIIDSDVKYVVSDIPDKTVLIQCLSRVRDMKDGSKIIVYIRNWSLKELTSFKEGFKSVKRIADEYEKDMNYSIARNRAGELWDSSCHVIDQNDGGKLILNKLRYRRVENLIDEYAEDIKNGFNNVILEILKVENVEYVGTEEELELKFSTELSEHLESVVGKKLLTAQQKKIVYIIQNNRKIANKFNIRKETKNITPKKLQQIIDYFKLKFKVSGSLKETKGVSAQKRYIVITKIIDVDLIA